GTPSPHPTNGRGTSGRPPWSSAPGRVPAARRRPSAAAFMGSSMPAPEPRDSRFHKGDEMRAPRILLLAVLSAASLAVAVNAVHAQPTLKEGGYLVGEFPTGDWAEAAGAGLGLDGTSVVHTNPSRPLAVRSQFGIGYNFSRTVNVPQANVGPLTTLELETSNFSLWFGIGPELSPDQGNVVPFVFGTVGLNVNWMNQSLSGTVNALNYDANVGAAGTVFAWSAGGGLRKEMPTFPGRRVELSAEYRSGVDAKYVMPDEVT